MTYWLTDPTAAKYIYYNKKAMEKTAGMYDASLLIDSRGFVLVVRA